MWVASVITASLPLLASAFPFPNPPGYGGGEPFFFKGHDLSSLKILEDGGAVYVDTERGNVTRPAEDILGDGGMNTVRLRLWVYPKAPYDGKLSHSVSTFHQRRYLTLLQAATTNPTA